MFHAGYVKTREDNSWHARITRVSTDLSQRDDGLSRPVPNGSVACCWRQHCCSSVTTACNRPVENSIAAALSQQLLTDLLTGRCGPVRTDRYKASERIQISACWQQDLTDLLQICSDLRVSGCVCAAMFEDVLLCARKCFYGLRCVAMCQDVLSCTAMWAVWLYFAMCCYVWRWVAMCN
jgi:hypothetical protein